jgi:hypothetical protein
MGKVFDFENKDKEVIEGRLLKAKESIAECKLFLQAFEEEVELLEKALKLYRDDSKELNNIADVIRKMN